MRSGSWAIGWENKVKTQASLSLFKLTGITLRGQEPLFYSTARVRRCWGTQIEEWIHGVYPVIGIALERLAQKILKHATTHHADFGEGPEVLNQGIAPPSKQLAMAVPEGADAWAPLED